MKAQGDESGGRICRAITLAAGRVMLRPIRLHCVGAPISAGLLCIHVLSKLHECTILTWTKFDWRWALRNVSTTHVEFTGDTARTNLLLVTHHCIARQVQTVQFVNIYYDRQSQQCFSLTCYLSYRMSYFRLHVSVVVWPSSGLQSYHVHVLIMQRCVYCRTWKQYLPHCKRILEYLLNILTVKF